MKTLKKILSLVLVVAMLASMMIVGAAAAEEETNYEEAVAVVTGLGIIEGDENGYNFAGNLTREQAAKIIAYMLLGKDTAEALKTGTAPFADVAANRWSAGYIAYLKGQGIISGVSDTEFDPTANVTGIAFAKMLLTAIGYGKNGELEGAAWDINTITFANQTGIYNGSLTASPANAATREEAMLYLFNALQVPTVNYNKTFESYYVGTSPLQSVDKAEEHEYSLGYLNYKLVKVSDENTTDEFGRPAAAWNANGIAITTAVSRVAPVATVYGGINSDTIYNAIGKAAADYVNAHKSSVAIYVNGELNKDIDNSALAITADLYPGHTGTNKMFGAGATVEIYCSVVGGKYSVSIVGYYEYLGTVGAVKTTGTTIAGKPVSSADFDLTGLAKGDQVLYTVSKGGKIASFVETAPVAGTYTGYTTFIGMYTAQVDGVSAGASKVADSSVSAGPTGALEIGITYNFYKDSQGNLLKAVPYIGEEVAVVSNYVYVLSSSAQLRSDGPFGDVQTTTASLQVAYADGAIEIVDMDIKNDKDGNEFITVGGQPITLTGKAAPGEKVANIVPAGWYVYGTSVDGNLVLKTALTTTTGTAYAAVVNGITTETNKVSLGVEKYTANKNTVLTVINPKTGLINTYTGIANFETIDTAKNNVLVTFAYGSSIAKTVTIIDDNYSGDTTNLLGYCAYSLGTNENGETWMFYINGAPTPILNDGTNFQAFVAGGHVYTLVENNGEYTVSDAKNFIYDEEEGFVNANYFTEPVGPTSEYVMYFISDPATNAMLYKETAVVATVEDNYFTTVAVTADDIEAESSVLQEVTKSITYYMDDNTQIVDTTFGGDGTLDEGDVFLAYVDTTTTGAYDGELYCTHIWIVA